MNIFPCPNLIIYTVLGYIFIYIYNIYTCMFKKSEKKKLVSNSKIQTAFKEPISQKSPQNSTFNHYPSSPPFLKNKPNQQKKKCPPKRNCPGSSTTWTPRTPSFVFVKSKSVNCDVSEVKSFAKASGRLGSHHLGVGVGRDGEIVSSFFFGQAKGNGGFFLKSFFGVL